MSDYETDADIVTALKKCVDDLNQVLNVAVMEKRLTIDLDINRLDVTEMSDIDNMYLPTVHMKAYRPISPNSDD